MDEGALRLAVFGGVFGTMAVWEWLVPRRQSPAHRLRRWTAHATIQIVNALTLRVMFPGAAVAVALWAQTNSIGLLSLVGDSQLLNALVFALSVVLLDLAIYAQHVATHRVPVLWRLHRMHHSDTFLDASSALRFHPVEILLSMVWKCAVILALGVGPWAVLVFEVLLNASAVFNHANARLPLALDQLLRKFIVTPDMHRVHHSVNPQETDRNFGFCLSIWDRVFGTYTAQPAAGHDGMTLGLERWRAARDGWPDRLLIQPVDGPAYDADVNGGARSPRP